MQVVQKLCNGAGIAAAYWGRSADCINNYYNIYYIGDGGQGSLTGGYDYSFGVAFGFCLGTAPAIPPIGTTLENCTWEQIKNIADAGMGDTYFNVGDTKNITTNGEIVTMQIYGFDHDEKADWIGDCEYYVWVEKFDVNQ